MNIIRNICPHQKRLIQCSVCNGGGICIHGDIRSMCRKCVYSEKCEHRYSKKACSICSNK